MELKDVILSTLAEMEEEVDESKEEQQIQKTQSVEKLEESHKESSAKEEEKSGDNSSIESELIYLNSIRERLLVLFEGFQAPNNTNIEAKIDMTLNFLEYTLATIDARVEKLEKGNMQ